MSDNWGSESECDPVASVPESDAMILVKPDMLEVDSSSNDG